MSYGIKLTYTIHGVEDTNGSATFPADEDWAVGLRPSTTDQPRPGESSYTGMHDAGPLVPLRQGGPVSKLIGAVHKAKQHSDAYLTKRIAVEEQKVQHTGDIAGGDKEGGSKKQKMSE